MLVILMLFNLNVYKVKTFLLIFYFFFQKFLFFCAEKKIMSTFYFLTIFKTIIIKLFLFCEYDRYFYVIHQISKQGFEHTFLVFLNFFF